MLQKVTVLPTDSFKKGLVTYSNFFRLEEGQTPACSDICYNNDESIAKRLGHTSMNTIAMQNSGGYGMFDFGVSLGGLDTMTKLLIHADGADGSATFEDASASGHEVTASEGAQVDTTQRKWGTGSLQLYPYAVDTKLLLHFDGADGATSTTDETGKAVTMVNTAQLDTGNPKWDATLLLDGNSDYVTLVDSDDWDIVGSATENWTIDLWVKHADHAGTEYYVSQYENANNRWELFHVHGTGLRFNVVSGGSVIVDVPAGGEITDTNWHHIALVKVADKYAIYKDGTQVNYVKDSSTDTFTALLSVGADTAPGNYFQGNIDDVRITNSNAFSAAPDSGKTDTITVPTGPHRPRLTIPDSDDFHFTGDFTIDTQLRFEDTSGCVLMQHGNLFSAVSDKSWAVEYSSPHIIFKHSTDGTSYALVSHSWAPVAATWYHLAIVLNDTNLMTFIDGAQLGTNSLVTGFNNSTDNLIIGIGQDSSSLVRPLSGWMDEIRISNGTARWVSAFTSPAEEYGSENIQAMRILCASGTGIYYSTDLARTWTVCQTSRSQAINNFSFIKDYAINCNNDYQNPQYWAGTAGSFFIDIAADSAPTCKYPDSYQGFAFLLNEKIKRKSVFYVDQNDMFIASAWDNFQLPTFKNDEITGSFTLRRRFYVSTKFKLFRLGFIGGNPDWSYTEVKSWGFVPKTFKKIQIPQVGEVIIGLDWTKKIRIFDGVDDEIISDAIKDDNGLTNFYLSNLNEHAFLNSWAENDTKKEVWRLHLTYGDSSITNRSINFNYRIGAFFPYTNQPFASGVLAQDTAQGLHMLGCDINGYVHHLDSGNTDNGTPIDEKWLSPFLFRTTPGRQQKIQKMYMYFNNDSTGTIYYEDRNDFSSVWNLRKEFVLTTAVSSVMTSQTVDLPTIANVYQFALSTSASTAEAWKLNRFDLYQTELGIGKP